MSSAKDASNRTPKAPSLKQKRYIDSLARQLGYEDGQAFMREWAGKDRRGLLVWTARTVSLAIDEAKKRLHQPAASSATAGTATPNAAAQKEP